MADDPVTASAASLDLSRLSAEGRAEIEALFAEMERRQTRRLLWTMFPDAGPLRRDLYPKHLEFFAAGRDKSERVFLSGNRVGKTVCAGVELTFHLTGQYPDWWPGRRFTKPIRALASGDTHETTRDILQIKLLGATTDRPLNIGTGLMPGDSIIGCVPRPHVKGAIDKVVVRHHPTGGESELWLRSYVQGREIFQGFELDVFWPDEECPEDVYDEGQIRLMTTRGLSMLTFTPIKGRTALVNRLLDTGNDGAEHRAVVMCGWDDAPHLDETMKAQMWAKLPPHQRDARTKGVPSLGSGAIYPVSETEITCEPFKVPDHWPRAYGMDVGWNTTAAVWGAMDRDADVLYIYAEHYRSQAEPSIHAAGIRARGNWIDGAIDPASRGRAQKDGEQLLTLYRDLGLRVTPADNGVESGLFEVWERLSTGRLKIFRTCTNTLAEYRLYRRDDKGRVVKERDHAMDSLRYLVKTGIGLMRNEPREERSAKWHSRLNDLLGHQSALGT